MIALALSRRLRRTAFGDAVAAAGATAVMIYGRTRPAVAFTGLAEDCAHLKRAVRDWDTSCQRQVRIVGPDVDVRPCDRAWPVRANGRRAGCVISAAWAPERGGSVAIGMNDGSAWGPGEDVAVETPEGERPVRVRERFWN